MIRQARIEDLPRLWEYARESFSQSRFLKRFELERFCGLWTALLEQGAGGVFVLEDEAEELAGALMGVVYPEPYSDELTATEFAWFVRPGHRGEGIRLYRAFEQWARERGCARIRMVHLTDVMPAKLANVYRRLGFEPAEVHYVKEL